MEAKYKDIKSSIDHNSNVLQSIYTTVHEMQGLFFKQDKKILSLEAQLHHLTSTLTPLTTVTSASPQEQDGGQGSVDTSESLTGQVTRDVADRKLMQDLVEDVRRVLSDVKKDVKEEIREELQNFATEQRKDQLNSSWRKELKEEIREELQNFVTEQKKDQMNSRWRKELKEELQTALSDVKMESKDNLIHFEDKMTKMMIEENKSQLRKLGEKIDSFVSSNMDLVRREMKTEVAGLVEEEGKTSLKVLEGTQRLTNLAMLMNSKLIEDMAQLNSSVQNSASDMRMQINRQNRKMAQITQEGKRSLDVIEEWISHLVDEVEGQSAEIKVIKENTAEQLSLVEITNEFFKANGGFHKLLLQECRSIIDQIITESTINREILLKERTKRQSYLCEFNVMNFSLWVGSGERQYSRIWYIDQVNSYVKGFVQFTKDNKVLVSLDKGCYNRVFGLKPVDDVCEMKVTATIVDEDGDEWMNLQMDESVNFRGSDIDAPVDGWYYTRLLTSFTPLTCDEINTSKVLDNDILTIKYNITL